MAWCGRGRSGGAKVNRLLVQGLECGGSWFVPSMRGCYLPTHAVEYGAMQLTSSSPVCNSYMGYRLFILHYSNPTLGTDEIGQICDLCLMTMGQPIC
jgi:hypothetical protein